MLDSDNIAIRGTEARLDHKENCNPFGLVFNSPVWTNFKFLKYKLIICGTYVQCSYFQKKKLYKMEVFKVYKSYKIKRYTYFTKLLHFNKISFSQGCSFKTEFDYVHNHGKYCSV